MPVVPSSHPLPSAPQRILVAGTSGSGKTTLARDLAAVLGIEHVEIDGLFHGPGWTPRPTFLQDVEELATRPSWVTEWQYADARPVLAARADLVVWLDLPRRTVMRQVVRRTLRRRLRREVLWNDNVEPPLATLLSDRDHIVRWAWRTHHQTAERVTRLAAERPDLPIVRIRTRAEARAWPRTMIEPD
ncbi:MAG TPA: AAA family ATPase [Nocardioides sp.]|nr:AAA family ATPase [Nocardioides sp.]